MVEKMNITYIIGNGFDLNLDLKTSYSSFLEYYLSKKTNNEVINIFKNNIKQNISLWSDLEIALGQSTELFYKQENPVLLFNECYNDILSNLGEYLLKIQNDLSQNIIDQDLLICFGEAIRTYLSGLKQTEIDSINRLSRNIEKYNCYTFLNFNYTNILDWIYKSIETNENSIILGRAKNSGTWCENKWVNNIHVHGDINGYMILGVDNESQIKHINIFDDDSISKSQMIKTETDEMIGNNVDKDSCKYLNNSDIIYLYGLSIGMTDAIWWKRIIDAMKQNDKLVLITYSHALSKIKNQSKSPLQEERIRDKIKTDFLAFSDYEENNKIQIRNRIYVTGNDIFSSFAERFKEKKKVYVDKEIDIRMAH